LRSTGYFLIARFVAQASAIGDDLVIGAQHGVGRQTKHVVDALRLAPVHDLRPDRSARHPGS
jgi:hypothetical protein